MQLNEVANCQRTMCAVKSKSTAAGTAILWTLQETLVEQWTSSAEVLVKTILFFMIIFSLSYLV